MLTEAGVALIPRGADRVELSYADARATLTVVASPTPPQVEAAERPAKRGPVPWGTFTLLRRMVQRPYATQQELAVLVGVSQPRVSQALRTLADQDVVQRTSSGWTLRNLDEAIRWWLENYPGPGGISTYWYGLAPAVEQARTVVEMVAAPDPHGVAVSGDVAADIIAPWRAPTRAILYASTGVNLADEGFIPAGAEEATLEFTVPRDPGLWQPSGMAERFIPDGLPLADPIQILWDVRRSPGSDSEDAAQRVWDLLRRDHRDRGYAA
ncbi:hypothetical protein AB0873_05120 [Micromonospora sp. NPDC047707]|uniref:winged helix-turn-helix transcriptional regulator n=1 Tax=Micromonospora sp. NPDC047707 TaxID=3154498 RepID=UPI003452643C